LFEWSYNLRSVEEVA